MVRTPPGRCMFGKQPSQSGHLSQPEVEWDAIIPAQYGDEWLRYEYRLIFIWGKCNLHVIGKIHARYDFLSSCINMISFPEYSGWESNKLCIITATSIIACVTTPLSNRVGTDINAQRITQYHRHLNWVVPVTTVQTVSFDYHGS